jgi:hypothetical protein
MANATLTSSGMNVTSEDDAESRPPRMVFLGLFMALSLSGNTLVIYGSIVARRTLVSVQSVALVNMAALCLGDALLNMTLVMASLAAGKNMSICCLIDSSFFFFCVLPVPRRKCVCDRFRFPTV